MSTATMHAAEEATPYWQLDLRGRLNHTLFVKDVNQVQMAEALGVHRNTVRSYLRSDNPVTPDRRTIVAWAVRCGVNPGWLETGAAPSQPDGGSDLPVQSSPWIADVVDLGPRRSRTRPNIHSAAA